MDKERFFGLHFDFHASNDSEIGTGTDPADIEWYITEANPDFIQCDCKGHRGLSSYDTKVGNPANDIKKDNLKIWCDTVHKHNLPIYMHYSGVWDMEFAQKNPSQAALDDKLEPTGRASLFGNYLDTLMIPQIKELITEYGIDGMWVDGDCWAVHRDYSDIAKKHIPEGVSKEEFNKIMHDVFLDYVRKYTDELHSFKPDFKITSNWAYTSYIPEKPSVNIDFISGDFNASNSVHEARYEPVNSSISLH